MVDIIKQDMTDIWASSGDKTAPDPSKIATGWIVEAVPRQWWNWFENRQDVNIAYMLQKGIPEWDIVSEYLTNKSYIQRNNVVYKCIQTNSGQDPATAPLYWTKAFPESSDSLEALRTLTPAADQTPYYTGANSAALMTVTAFARTLLDDPNVTTMRATLGAQATHPNLTALSSATGTATNTLPYFNSSNTMIVTPLTAFARSLLDDVDVVTARATLEVDSAATVAANLSSSLSAGLATKQDLDATLTALAGLATGVNQLAYSTGTDTFAQTTLTAFARSILDDADAVTVRATIGADDAANLTTGTLPLARLPADLTGKNAATATALQTSRTIQGVPFNGTANITLSVVDKDSSVGSATLPAGTTAQRTASPVNGQIRYNSDNNEFEGYINGSWGGIGGGTPLFTTLWWPSRTAIPSGYVAADGQLLTRATYNAAWPRINAGDVPFVTDAVWLATSTSRGSYSNGNGSTTFRVPDLNGKQAGTIAAPFLRGDGTNSTGVAGQFQGSDNLAHTHSYARASQAALAGVAGGGQAYFDNNNGAGTTVSSGGVESRPVNVTGVYIIKLIGGASDLTQEDASVAVAALDTRVSVLSGRNRIINGAVSSARRAAFTFTSGVGGYGGPDRYIAANSNAGGSFTQSVGTLVHGGVTKNCVLQTVNSVMTDYSGIKYWNGISQRIEGNNCYDLKGQPVVISFLFKGSIGTTYTVAVSDGGSTQSYVSTFTVSANTVTKIVVKVPAIPSSCVIPQSNALGLVVLIGALNGATFQTSTLNAWQPGNYFSASTAGNWGLTAGATIAVAELQLEVGTEETPFEHRSHSLEQILCDRYYQSGTAVCAGYSTTGTGNSFPYSFTTVMRAPPTMSYGIAVNANLSSFDVRDANVYGFTIFSTVAGTGGYIWSPNWTAQAEL